MLSRILFAISVVCLLAGVVAMWCFHRAGFAAAIGGIGGVTGLSAWDWPMPFGRVNYENWAEQLQQEPSTSDYDAWAGLLGGVTGWVNFFLVLVALSKLSS